MITQLIIGTNDLKSFEILKAEQKITAFNKIERKTVDLEVLIKALSKLKIKSNNTEVNEELISSFNTLNPYNKNVLQYYKTNLAEYYVYNFKNSKIRTFYNGNLYKLNFGNSIVLLKVSNSRIIEYALYPYEKFKGDKTKLYFNPMPNTYSTGKVCIGTLDRSFSGNVGNDVKRLLEGTYTHSYTDFADQTLHNTTNAFNYLSRNEFPYSKLKKVEDDLGTIITKFLFLPKPKVKE